MNLSNLINLENVLFSCEKQDYQLMGCAAADDDKNKLNEKLKSLLNTTFRELNLKHQIKNTDVERFEIGSKQITYHTRDHQEFNILHAIDRDLNARISKLPQTLLTFQRDIVGEKILEISKNKNFSNLYLYSSGGGGHKSAKEAEMERDFKSLMEHVNVAIEENGVLNIDVDINTKDLRKGSSLINDERLKNPAKLSEWCQRIGLVKDIDVLHDFLGKVGIWATSQWDQAQQEGDVVKQESLASQQWLSDLFFGPVIFISTLLSLVSLKPKQIVSTQAMATPSILLAIKLYNLFFKAKGDQEVKLHLYMTDMPTEYAQHFFSSLKRITDFEGKDCLVLHAPKVDEGADWQKLCGLPNERVKELDVHELPVRLDFLKAVNDYQPNLEHPSVEIKVSDQQELMLLHEVMHYQAGNACDLGNKDAQGVQLLNYQMKPEDKGMFIMLGSQPTKSAIESYVQEYLELARANPNTHHHLFTFTGKFEKEGDCFYKQLISYIKNQPNWPSNLSVVPLSYQTSKQLVSLEMACDTITRSGGGTTMELLVLNEVNKKFPALPTRQRWVHAQQIKGRSLEESIPLWEKGNYLFIKKKMNAKVIDPKSFKNAILQAV